MSLEEAISMEPVKKKLRNLSKHMPGQERIIYDFAEFLADRLNPELAPQGFMMAAELALYDAQKGVDGFSGKCISGRLSGYPSQIYALIRTCVPDIVEAVCPEDFAKGVKEVYDAVNANIKKAREADKE